jgi:hypothetical protein
VRRDPFDDKTKAEGPRSFSLAGMADGIQVTVVHDEPPEQGGRRRIYEIWTERRIYLLDENRYCVSVIDREKSKADPKHAFLNTRLMGGQQKEREGISVSHPLPLPGMNAVFELKQPKSRFGTTTKVERVVMRVMMTNLHFGGGEAPSSEETTRLWEGWMKS